MVFDNREIAGKDDVLNPVPKSQGWGYRHVQCLILFLTLSVAMSMRSCMGVALVAMTQTAISANVTEIPLIDDVNSTNTVVIDEYDAHNEGILKVLLLSSPYPKFKWNKKLQDAVMSSFFWGYMFLQIPAGQLLHRFGLRYILTGAMVINCVISLFLPLAAYYGGWICLVVFRVIQGLSQACLLPGIHMFFGKWATLEERGRLMTLTYGGVALGTVLGLPITGFIASSPLGWPGIFRFFGVLSGVVAYLVWWLIADTPAGHTKMSLSERKYIEHGLGQIAGYEKMKLPVPWSKILRHPGVYAIIISHIGSNWCHIILFTEIPAFMDKVMGVNIKANGVLTALPFLSMWIASFFFSWFTDMLIVKKVMSVTHVRKLANSIGSIPSSIGLIALAYVPKNIYVVETILVLICIFKASTPTGFQVNHIDISPNFAGTLMSLSNFASNAVASLAPIVAGVILTDVTSEYLWSQVFLIAGGLFFVCNLFYLTFGIAERADWNNPHSSKIDPEKLQESSPMIVKQDGR